MLFYQNLNERPRSRVDGKWRPAPTGLPTRGRASWSPDDESRTRLGVEWNLPSARLALGLTLDSGGDHDALLHLGLPPVDLYLSAEHRFLRGLTDGRRELSLHLHDWAAWWCVWVDGHSWSRSTPRWRQGSFHYLDALLGDYEHSERPLVERDVEVHMPEGKYAGHCLITEGTWRRKRWPFARRVVRAKIEMTEPVPVPGKGENSWDCGQDAIHGSTFPAASVAEAVGKFVGDVLRTRERYGGPNWRPEAEKAATRP